MSSGRVDLVWIGKGEPSSWSLGETFECEEELVPLAETLAAIESKPSDAIVTWSSHLGAPDPELISEIVARPGDAWHAGLKLGTGGIPTLLEFVRPTWMLAVDPPTDAEASSWRVSLRASVVRTEVLRRLGGLQRSFETLMGASLELGHRYATSGALTRYVPSLVVDSPRLSEVDLPIEDEVTFLHYTVGRFWTRWALVRGVMCGRVQFRDLMRLWGSTVGAKTGRREHVERWSQQTNISQSITVLIPTLDRYHYLDSLLGQLAQQTVPPRQVIVIDQTPPPMRRSDFVERFPSLPLEWLTLDSAGQCSARNTGLRRSTEECVLFLDDDDEIPNDLIERHLSTLDKTGADVSSGVAEEVGAGPLPESFEHFRLSDVFPTNNTMIKRKALEASGLFDLAFERGPRADADLGMRVYLSGSLMVLDPEIRVLHHHAPSGGLRAHQARRVTYASSRQRLFHRHLPATTEIYLMRRYFNRRQVLESLLLRVLGTFVVRGGLARRGLNVLLGALLLPHTLIVVVSRYHRATELLGNFPRIPTLGPSGREGVEG